MTELPKVDISILLYKSKPYLDEFLKSLEEIEYPEEKLTIYFIHNASPDDSFEYVQKKCKNREKYRFLDMNANLGFAGGHNVTFRVGKAPFTMILNTDGKIDKNAIKILIKKMLKDTKIGAAECKQVPKDHPKPHDEGTGETPWASGASTIYRKDALRQSGLFDESFFMYAEDVDLSWRLWCKGWKCVYVKEAVFTHYVLEMSKHKHEQDINLSEHFHTFRNDMYMRMIYRGPIGHAIHMFRIFRLITFKKKFIFGCKLAIYPFYRILRFITKKRIKIFDFNPKDPQYLLLKSIISQFRHYPHILWRWFLQTKNPKHGHIKFYGIKTYDKGDYS